MRGTRSAYRKIHKEMGSENKKERDHLEDTGILFRVIFNYAF
jgi:hypothetical protein